ncbi:hypothetical protein V1502_16995 [Bacillus sp. SCS-153A]|uniref:hypothetical protein n=1 Tax=Rossellomorea sedimentorum TaxID=3115294 RepID=UPI003905DC82
MNDNKPNRKRRKRMRKRGNRKASPLAIMIQELLPHETIKALRRTVKSNDNKRKGSR